jgi:hypothetical protein
MRRAVRENALCVLAAAAVSAAMAWLGLYGFAWSDYETEAQPALNALTHGHVLAFLRLAPAYGGSLVERAPFALAPGLWGGGQLAVYRMVALPCLLAAAALGVWLCARMRAAGGPALWRAVTLGVCVANPLTLRALELGHPEELLGACLCVAAVLLAGRDRPIWAGVLLGLAIANKEWALLVAGPVLLALPVSTGGAGDPSRLRARMRAPRRHGLCLASAMVVTAVVLAPLVLASPGGFAAGARGAAAPRQELVQPWQIWWFLGTPNHVSAPTGNVRTVPMNAALSTHPGWRIAPVWLTGTAHLLIVLIMLPLTLLAWRARRRPDAPLMLLALLLLLRCLLDPWDTAYYALPFVFALLAWEVLGEHMRRRPPVLALASTALAWWSYQWLPAHGASPDVQAAVFMAWTLPLGAGLALWLYGGERTRISPRSRLAARTTTPARRSAIEQL